MNGRVLVIGAGGVATVAIVKMAMNSDIFKEIKIASRTKAKCDNVVKYINEKLPNCKAALTTAQVDADDDKRITVLPMQPLAGGNFRQEILGYSLMSALGIKSEEIKANN